MRREQPHETSTPRRLPVRPRRGTGSTSRPGAIRHHTPSPPDPPVPRLLPPSLAGTRLLCAAPQTYADVHRGGAGPGAAPVAAVAAVTGPVRRRPGPARRPTRAWTGAARSAAAASRRTLYIKCPGCAPMRRTHPPPRHMHAHAPARAHTHAHTHAHARSPRSAHASLNTRLSRT